ncbi:MAG: GEVED domain-containing protein [Planctomycetaceae bacterium]
MSIQNWLCSRLSPILWLREDWCRSRSRRQVSRRRQVALRQTPVENLEPRLLLTLDIRIDYTYDTSGFFNVQARRDVLEQVASVYESRITDTLDAIVPSGGNSWNAIINNPTTGAQTTVSNPTIPADTVVVYVGARNLSSGLGIGGPGGFSSVGSPAFNTAVETRGESGVIPNGTNDTDFAPWGGTISFDNSVNWNFSQDPPTSGQNDFYSVALHEMAHVLGYGTAESFRRLTNTANRFTGAASVAANGGTVPMHSDGSHWVSGTTSTLPGTTTVQEAAMDPQITTGTRKHFTNLDWAALDDLGWDVSPVAAPVDYGDAPDATAGTGPQNYNSRSADNGPHHTIVSGLFIGDTPADGDDGSRQNASASADDSAGTDDEGFVGSDALSLTAGTAGFLQVNVTNNTATAATLTGWVDFNADGVFSSGERAQASVPAGTTNGNVTLNFPEAGEPVTTFARFRLSTDAAAGNPVGAASDGEVEDHPISIVPNTTTIDTLPSFNWPATTGALRYELEVTDVTNGNNVIILQSQLSKTSYRPENALRPGTYAWRYRAVTAAGPLGYSDPQQFTIQEKIGSPTITDPVAANPQTGTSSLPTFAWSATPSATRYQLWVDDIGNNISRVINQLDLSQTSFTPSTSLPAGSYRAWVRAFSDSGALGGWSDPFLFSVAATAANAGEITSPAGTSTNAAPVIAWRPTTGTQRLIVTNTVTGDRVIDVSPVEGLSYTPPTGLPPGSYEARIEVNGVAAAGGPSTFQIVATTAGRAEFTRIYSDESNPVPVLGWTAVPNATRYDLWIDDVTNGVSRHVFENTLSGTAYQPTTPLTPGTYRAWVRANNGGSSIGGWSSPVTFQVTEASSQPTIWAPVSNTLNTLPTIAWSAVQNTDSYVVRLRQNQTLLRQLTVTTNHVTVDETLSPGSYQIEVTARRAGLFDAIQTAEFTVGTSTGSVRLLNSGGSTFNTRPTFTWPIVDTATRYAIWINDETRSVVATVFNSDITGTSFTPDEALLPGTYRVWVRAFDNATAVTPWSTPLTVIVAESTGAPVITSPAATTDEPVPAITWSAVAGAASYQVEIYDTDQSPAIQVYAAQGLTSTVHRPPQVFAVGNYRVRVRSVDASGTPSAWSDDRAFTIASAPASAVVRIVAPAATSTVSGSNVFFAWTNPGVAGVQYELWVNNVTAGNRAIHETTLTANSFTAAALPAGQYRAWVRMVGAGVNPAWSVAQNFTIE